MTSEAPPSRFKHKRAGFTTRWFYVSQVATAGSTISVQPDPVRVGRYRSYTAALRAAVRAADHFADMNPNGYGWRWDVEWPSGRVTPAEEITGGDDDE